MASSSSSPMSVNGDGNYSVITVASLKETVNGTEWLLDPSAGNESFCIFRVPKCLVDVNKNTYGPHIVSIGPYHHGEKHLEMMQQHKRRFLRDLLAQTPPTGPGLDDYQQAVALREEEIRGCYSESTLKFCKDQLVDMMLLDGLFIIELLCKIGGLSKTPIGDDPIFHFASVFTYLIRDLLRLENQIPFFVLQTLFNASRDSRHASDSSLAELALQLFESAVEIPYGDHDQGKHLLDLLRLSFIHPSMRLKEINLGFTSSSVQIIQSAKKLHLAGIKFKARHAQNEAMSFLDIRFSNGVLEIPLITLDDLCTDLLLNFIAFEQCYSHSPRHITTYAAFMSCLVRSPTDAAFLCEHDIIEKYIATDEEVANFFRNMGKDVPFDIGQSYLLELFKDVNEYQRNMWHVRWAGFRLKYFDTPWSFLSALAAVILLLFTAIQTFFAVYAYVLPPKDE
ncbi:hypothetical protein RchiOBHm_Chr2g0103321 [Rosa chinensis]|uniref:Uncharacterized protein n=1 Tax=Rosa chinensis TaxID=74649 RepID=A0A2P6RMW6_ROSCH|nr:UPF0481 protein At3g47200 [Rosa chinensis]PRQ47768.1 hypothetical protein RchiOBHm_Chr2g0103321 [Rosa chinensis]